MRKKHAVRALVLHATPTGDFYVSACDGTATTVLVKLDSALAAGRQVAFQPPKSLSPSNLSSKFTHWKLRR